mgnify:CR=1 FL=1
MKKKRLKPRTKALLVLLMLFTSDDAFAITSEHLIKECEKTSPFCLAYMIGIEDGLKYGALNSSYLFAGFIKDESMRLDFANEVMRTAHGCWPEGITHGQRIKIFVKFMEEHPERLHEQPYHTYGDAMGAAFPCKE